MSDAPLVLWLAWRDWIAEWRTSACLAIGVAAGAAPLLILFSIRSGVLEGMRAELERYPSSRELRTSGQPTVSWRLVQALRARADVAFAAPQTRLLAASGVVRAATRAQGEGAVVDLLPSGPGDPLASAAHAPPWRSDAVVLSDLAARDAGLHAGDRALLVIDRVRADGARQVERATLTVSAVLPGWASGQRSALIDPDLLTATEIYRENPDAPDLTAALAQARATRADRPYAGLRVYARSIDQVEALRTWLARQGLETEGRFGEIRLLRRLGEALTAVFVLIATVAAVGLCLSLAAAQWAWVERKRRDLGFLRLVGLAPGQIALMPAAQALITAVVGAALASATAIGGDALVNALLGGRLSGWSGSAGCAPSTWPSRGPWCWRRRCWPRWPPPPAPAASPPPPS